jgi:hypothetical protein
VADVIIPDCEIDVLPAQSAQDSKFGALEGEVRWRTLSSSTVSVTGATVEAFAEVAASAKAGKVLGGIMGVSMKDGRYYVNVSRNLARDPTLARGILAALDDHLAAMVRGMAAELNGKS